MKRYNSKRKGLIQPRTYATTEVLTRLLHNTAISQR